MNAPKMSAEQKRWQAENDADTMARYEEIMGNAARRNAAIKIARQKAAELNNRAAVMQRVASKPSPKKK